MAIVDTVWRPFYVFPGWHLAVIDLRCGFDGFLIAMMYFAGVKEFFAATEPNQVMEPTASRRTT
jgi:hypothetical protein